MKILMLFTLLFPIYSSAIDICSMEYLGLQNLVKPSQFKRANRVARLESLTSRFRNLKANTGIVEGDRFHIEQLIRMDHNLFEGNYYLADKEWRAFFRETESNFYKHQQYTKILAETKNLRGGSLDNLFSNLSVSYKNDPFSIELIKVLSSKRSSSVDDMVKVIEKEIKKSARYMGRHFTRYRLIREHIDYIITSKNCESVCVKRISEFKELLGVGGLDEKVRFPMFRELKRPVLSEVKALVNSTPQAYESMILHEALSELKVAIRDIITLPNSRRAFSNSVYKTLDKLVPNHKLTAQLIDKVLAEVESVTNHYPIINRLMRSNREIAKRFDRLRNQNVIFPNDEMMVTFARRLDQRAIDSWKELKKFAKTSDNRFHNKMVEAEKVAIKKGGLSPDYKRSPFRSFIYLLGGFMGYQALNLSFSVEEDGAFEMEEITDTYEVIELTPDAENKEVGNIVVKSEAAYEWMVDQTSILMEAILD